MTVAVGVLLGLAGGVAWSQLANPPAAQVTSTGLVLGETQLNQQVGVTMWFLVVGAALGVVGGYALCWKRSSYGVFVVAAVLVGSVLACLVSYYSGVHVFGPTLPPHVLDLGRGHRVVVGLSVTTDTAYLGWPVGALLGAVAAIVGWPPAPTPASLPIRRERPAPPGGAEDAT